MELKYLISVISTSEHNHMKTFRQNESEAADRRRVQSAERHTDTQTHRQIIGHELCDMNYNRSSLKLV